MVRRLSDAELVRNVRGVRTQIAFAELLGIAQSMVSDWERGAVTPSAPNWIKMAELVDYQVKVDCYERIGLPMEAVRILREAWSKEMPVAKKLLSDFGVVTEPVTEGLADAPLGGEPASLKGPSKSVEEVYARNAPASKTKRARRRKK